MARGSALRRWHGPCRCLHRGRRRPVRLVYGSLGLALDGDDGYAALYFPVAGGGAARPGHPWRAGCRPSRAGRAAAL